jgi:hypothetical protein
MIGRLGGEVASTTTSTDIEGGSGTPIRAAKPRAMDSPAALVPINSTIWAAMSWTRSLKGARASPS